MTKARERPGWLIVFRDIEKKQRCSLSLRNAEYICTTHVFVRKKRQW